ncbi:PQQ-dependent sugar dehydrogenase [Dankookia rubra]|uniref:PQQ-dependent sugar dehydrogenase n=1 Tax=Dankookia rubra TaxID=1442381 RepID=A0A4R5Q5V2_9PROT|nr:PQQ-dependent sugar dehydrogenase [Dankookia rubra]
MRKRLVLAVVGTALLVSSFKAWGFDGDPVRSDRAVFHVTTFATGLEHPWGAAFLPDGRLLVTERPGRMRVVDRDGRVSAPLGGVPPTELGGWEGGLLDVAPAPDFAATREIYFCHTTLVPSGALTRLARARLSSDATALEGATPILDVAPAQKGHRSHFGCRIVFGPRDGKVYLSTGDGLTDPRRAQRLDDLAGKVLRLERDGRPAAGNPFLNHPGARPEIWSYGHRNPQGLAFNPWTGSLWEAELGPRGGDEVNVIRAGGNYGWPLVTHGLDLDGSIISDLRSAPGMEDPLKVWTPVISPSGIAFYDGDVFPGWRGSLFLAALTMPGLVRLSLDGDRVTGEERLLPNEVRMRHVIQGLDGRLYILTDETEGRILRLR